MIEYIEHAAFTYLFVIIIYEILWILLFWPLIAKIQYLLQFYYFLAIMLFSINQLRLLNYPQFYHQSRHLEPHKHPEEFHCNNYLIHQFDELPKSLVKRKLPV